MLIPNIIHSTTTGEETSRQHQTSSKAVDTATWCLSMSDVHKTSNGLCTTFGLQVASYFSNEYVWHLKKTIHKKHDFRSLSSSETTFQTPHAHSPQRGRFQDARVQGLNSAWHLQCPRTSICLRAATSRMRPTRHESRSEIRCFIKSSLQTHRDQSS